MTIAPKAINKLDKKHLLKRKIAGEIKLLSCVKGVEPREMAIFADAFPKLMTACADAFQT